MVKPLIAAKMPAHVNLETGQYCWCACGQSTYQPFCNGLHHGSEFTTVLFKIEEM